MKNICLLFGIFLALVIAVSVNRKTDFNFSFSKSTFTDLESKGFKIVGRIERPYKYCYEQGLTFKSPDTLIESCGLYGKSSIQEYSLTENRALHLKALDENYFGEGADVYENPETGDKEIYQMTWRERKVFIFLMKICVERKDFRESERVYFA